MKTTEDYPVLIRKLSEAEGGGYLAEFPDLPGCMADGESPEEAYRESHGALASYLASLEKFNVQSTMRIRVYLLIFKQNGYLNQHKSKSP
jgi:predicted RNase H-like HicB family nuclease